MRLRRPSAWILHEASGRYVRSYLEYDVAEYLWANGTPFASGIDALTAVGDGTGRSDDFVIPARPGICEATVRLEIAGMLSALPEGPLRDAYMASKEEVHAHFEDDPLVDHRILPPPANSRYTREELDHMLGDIIGGGSAAMEAFDSAHPSIRPGSSYHALEEIIEELRPVFAPGDFISWAEIDEHFGTESVKVQLNRLLPGQTMARLCDILGTVSAAAPYNETEDQFLTRLQAVVDENGGALPSTHQLNSEHPWATVQYLNHYESWSEVLDALRLPPNRITNSVEHEVNIADAVAVAAALGKESLTTTDLQRPRTDDEKVRRCAVNLNGRLAYHVRVGKTEFTNVREYVNDLLRQGRDLAGGEA